MNSMQISVRFSAGPWSHLELNNSRHWTLSDGTLLNGTLLSSEVSLLDAFQLEFIQPIRLNRVSILLSILSAELWLHKILNWPKNIWTCLIKAKSGWSYCTTIWPTRFRQNTKEKFIIGITLWWKDTEYSLSICSKGWRKSGQATVAHLCIPVGLRECQKVSWYRMIVILGQKKQWTMCTREMNRRVRWELCRIFLFHMWRHNFQIWYVHWMRRFILFLLILQPCKELWFRRFNKWGRLHFFQYREFGKRSMTRCKK